MAETVSASLARVVNDLGDTLLEVLAGDLSNRADLGGVVLYDARREQSFPERAVVLGVGVGNPAEIEALLEALAKRRAAALVVGMPLEVSAELEQAARESGVVLLGLTAGASWLQLADVVRTILTSDAAKDVPDTIGGMPSGDLFALANAIASLIDAPITIEDRRFRVLAFSGRQDEADPGRIRTIIERQVADVYVRDHEERGVLRELYSSDEPIFVDVLETIDEPEIPRVAMAVRAGDEILGSIWAAVHGPMSPEHSNALRDVAPLVALHLLRQRAGADVDRRLRTDLVATALEGGVDAQQAVERLGLSQRSVTVIAVDLLRPREDEADASRLVAERQRLADALAMHLTAMAPRSEVAILGDVAYGLVPVTGEPEAGRARVKIISEEFLKRVGDRAPAVVGIGSVVSDAPSLRGSRLRADRALRVLRMRGVSAAAAGEDVYVDGLLLELGDLARSRNEALAGPLTVLREYDERRNSRLVETLRFWLDAFGDVNAASAAVGVHPNTFRYRLKRLSEVGGVDLDDPTDRFALLLQLRLTDATSD